MSRYELIVKCGEEGRVTEFDFDPDKVKHPGEEILKNLPTFEETKQSNIKYAFFDQLGLAFQAASGSFDIINNDIEVTLKKIN